MSFEEADYFGLFQGGDGDGGQPAPPLTYAQYLQLVLCVAASMEMPPERVLHYFNIAAPWDAAVDATQPQAQEAPMTLNPPLCVHLHHAPLPSPLPTVVSPGPPPPRPRPHVHCLRCLRGVDSQTPVSVVAELGGNGSGSADEGETLVSHHRAHKRLRDKYVAMLEGEVVAYVGESGDEFDMDSESGEAACEAAAEDEGQHCCFLVSAGPARCPVLVRYCAECRQLAPLVGFTEEGKTVEDGNMILARLLLACHVLFLTGQLHQREQGTEDESEKEEVAEEEEEEEEEETDDKGHGRQSRVFLFRPELILGDAEFTEDFEEGVECTYVSAVLPWASVVLPDDHDVSASSTEETERQAQLRLHAPSMATAAIGKGSDSSGGRGISPWAVSGPVVKGFVMEWASGAVAADRVRRVLERDSRYQCKRSCLVYLGDTQSWVLADVPCHYVDTRAQGQGQGQGQVVVVGSRGPVDATSLRPYAGAPTEDPESCIQVGTAEVALAGAVSLPMTLWCAYTRSHPEEFEDENEKRLDGNQAEEEEETTAQGPTTAAAIIAAGEDYSCPFSLDSRTTDFFYKMTTLAVVLAELLERPPAL